MYKLSHGQQIALDYHLSEYPRDLSFKEICKLLKNDSDKVEISFSFIDISICGLIEMMSDLASTIDKVIVDCHLEFTGIDEHSEYREWRKNTFDDYKKTRNLVESKL